MKSCVTGFKINEYGLRYQILIDTESGNDVTMSFNVKVTGTKEDAVKLSEYLLEEAINYCDDYREFVDNKKKDLSL